MFRIRNICIFSYFLTACDESSKLQKMSKKLSNILLTNFIVNKNNPVSFSVMLCNLIAGNYKQPDKNKVNKIIQI